MTTITPYSGGVQQETWFGKDLKIGLAKKDWLPNDGDYNLWFEGSCTKMGTSGGTRDAETVKCMGGYNKQYQKAQEPYEITLDILPTDTTFDELLMGDDGFYAELFDSYVADANIQTAWTEAGDGANPTLDTTYFLSGKQSGKFTFTDSSHSSVWVYDLSTSQGAVIDISGFTGTGAANATRGRAEMFVYIPTTAIQGHITTISLRVGSDSTHFSQYNYTVSGNTVVGWNRIVYDMTTADASTGVAVWTAIDYIALALTTSGGTSEYIYVDRIRIYDPLIASDMVPGYWRLTMLYQTSSSAAVGEKRRCTLKNCQVTKWEPESDSDGYLKATVTLQAPAMDASGNPNMLIEHTPDASEAALTAPADY